MNANAVIEEFRKDCLGTCKGATVLVAPSNPINRTKSEDSFFLRLGLLVSEIFLAF